MTEFLFPRDALCLGVNPEFFAPMPGGEQEKQVKAFCELCPVRAQCLEFALSWSDTEDVIYGGLTGAEREKLLRKVA